MLIYLLKFIKSTNALSLKFVSVVGCGAIFKLSWSLFWWVIVHTYRDFGLLRI